MQPSIWNTAWSDGSWNYSDFPIEGSAGLLVSGGSAASLTALAAARHKALGQLGIDVRKQGVSGNHARLRLYASAQVHSCIQKAVELLGLGSDCIRWIEVDEDFRISLDEPAAGHSRGPATRLASVLHRRERRQRSNGRNRSVGRARGFCVGIETLAACGWRLWRSRNVGSEFQAAVPGIERADSIALDPHKWLSVPVECGCVLVRDGALLRDTFSLVPPYIRTEPGKGIGNLPWFAEYGIQQTRGFRALKLWVTLANAGKSGLEQQISPPDSTRPLSGAKDRGDSRFRIALEGTTLDCLFPLCAARNCRE